MSEKKEKKKKEIAEEQEVVGKAAEKVSELDKLKNEKDELFAKLQRSYADMQNLRMRTAQERTETIDRTTFETVEHFVFPLIDDLDRALQAAVDHGYSNDDPLYHGVDMVRQHAFKLLTQRGIEPIDALEKPFDPLYHEAIMEQPSDEYPEKTVMQVVSRGYTQNGKTIRPARVVVSKTVSESEDKEQEDADL